MLQKIYINGFLIIDELQINFNHSMNSITGETGAGKSIIVQAIGLLIGGRGSKSYIRPEFNKTVLIGQFRVSNNNSIFNILKKYNIPVKNNLINVFREIYKNGHNICKVNDKIVNVNILKEVGRFLINIYGQNDNQSLVDVNKQIKLLDSYAGSDFNLIKKNYIYFYNKYVSLNSKLKELLKNQQIAVKNIDMMKFQLEEIQNANLQENEDENLFEEHQKLSNFVKIKDSLSNGFNILNNDNGILNQLWHVKEYIQKISSLSKEYRSINNNIESLYLDLKEVTNDLLNELDSLDFDENRLNDIESRINIINDLKNKYKKKSINEIKKYGDILRSKLNSIDINQNKIKELYNKKKILEDKLFEFANDLSVYRHKVALKLEKEMHAQLKDLYMDNVKFKVKFFSNKKLDMNGKDKVEFYIQTNPGEDFMPMIKVASGGELSRIMLSLRTIFSSYNIDNSIIFDEIGTGVSGKVAQSIAQKICTISKNNQVICITHLPQVAAISNKQFLVVKDFKNKHTFANIKEVNDKERIYVIAQMMSGSYVTNLTLENAKELLNLSQNQKNI